MPPAPSPPRAPPRPPPQPSAYKHFCRVCNKGFTCGSALGGHMRAHGVGDDRLGADEDDSLGHEPEPCARGGADGPWDTAGPSAAGIATHVYALRANPNRLIRSCQVCKNCGKEFSSWELFLEHGKCNSGEGEDADGSLRSLSPPSDADGEDDPALATGWSKGKRSRRSKLMAVGGDSLPAMEPTRCPAGEEDDVANLLVMLSSSKVEQKSVAEADQESCASASKEDGRRPQLLHPISFMACKKVFTSHQALAPAQDPAMALPLALPAPQYVSPVPRGMFECKACKKVFTSHQALGGHRASHKKVKGCFAAKIESNVSESKQPRHAAIADPNDDKGKAAAVEVNADATIVDASTDRETNAGTSEAAAALSMAITPIDHEPPGAALTVAPYKKKAKMHECSVCHRLFASGQALGGHKRCHWLTSSTADHANLPPLAAEGLVGAACHQLTLRPMVDAPEPELDLTIAASPSLPMTSAARLAEVGSSSLHLDTTAPLYFQPSTVPSNASHRNKTTATSGHNVNDAAGAGAAADDEADSTTVKRAKLSDLKDVSMAGKPRRGCRLALAPRRPEVTTRVLGNEPR